MGRCLGLYFFGCGDIANMSQPSVTPPPDLPEKDALIAALVARIEALVARIAELEASWAAAEDARQFQRSRRRRGRSRRAIRGQGKAKPHVGAHRPLHATQLPGAMSSPARAKAAARTYPASRKAVRSL